MNSISEKDLHLHVQILGWLRIAGAALMAVLGCFLLVLLAGIGMASGEREGLMVLSLIALISGGLMVVLALPGLIAGIGLLRRKNWGRILALIVAVFDVVNFPIGTVIAVYSFIVLLQNSATAYFGASSTPASAPTAAPGDLIAQ